MKKVIVKYTEINLNSADMYNSELYEGTGFYKVFNPDLNGEPAAVSHTWLVSVILYNGLPTIYAMPWTKELEEPKEEPKEEPIKQQIAGTVSEDFCLKAIMIAKDPRHGIPILKK